MLTGLMIISVSYVIASIPMIALHLENQTQVSQCFPLGSAISLVPLSELSSTLSLFCNPLIIPSPPSGCVYFHASSIPLHRLGIVPEIQGMLWLALLGQAQVVDGVAM